jgi:hypothetical protein
MTRVATSSSLTSTTIDRLFHSQNEAAWASHAECRGPDAPSMFADDWGVGRPGRRRRATALACCRRCPVRRDCGLRALAEAEAGLCLYGVRCGIEFTDVTPSRQQRDIQRLRTAVAGTAEASNGPRLRLVDTPSGRATGQLDATVEEASLAITA